MEPVTSTTLPPNLKSFLPNPQTPWLVSPSLFQRLQAQVNLASPYRKCEVISKDPEWDFILRYFEWQKPTNRSIGKVYCIHNPSQTHKFEADISSQEHQAQSSTFAPKWSVEDNVSLRKTVIQRWRQLTEPYIPYILPNQRKDKCHHTKIIPLWHGTKELICNSICSTGFTTFGKHELIKGTGQTQNTDIGFFGSGIYFTTSANYAAGIYSDGNLLLAWVTMREPYPVVADQECIPPRKPQDMKKLEGLGAYQNYNAHYIPVISIDPANSNCAIYYPCTEFQDPALDELVVFSSSQTLARFWIQLQADLLKAPTLTTVHSFLEHILNLLEKESIQQDPNLSQLLEQKSEILIVLNPQEILTPPDQEFYNWVVKLFDETGKVRNFVQKKLQQIHNRKEILGAETVSLSPSLQHTQASLLVPAPPNTPAVTQKPQQTQSLAPVF